MGNGRTSIWEGTSMNLTELKEGLAVHTDTLHLDAQEQPRMAEEAGEMAAEAKAAAKRAKLEADEAKAEVEQDVRKRPDTYGLEKVTDKPVAAAVALDDRVKAAERNTIEKQEVADKVASVANAYEHRRSMLGIEAKLWLANYWGDVTVREREMGKTADQVKAERFERGQGRRRRRVKENDDEGG